jgi:peptidoglycan/xylan/chitin deacetylase (PgdA/CDA1 family)
MLKCQNIIIASLLLLISILVLDYFIHIRIWWYAGIILATVGMLAYGSADFRSGFYCKVLYKGKMDNKTIALTFDDGPDKTVTPAVLDVLKAQNIRASFFCIGHKAEENPDLIKRIDEEGHIIGSHSYSHHFFFDLFSSVKMLTELKRTDDILGKILNKKIKMFRPPYGVTNPPLAKALKKMHYYIIGWGLRSKDTVIKNEELLYQRLTDKVKPGDIILFHDTKNHMVAVLDKFIKFAKEKGYHFECPDKFLGIEAYE